VYEHEYIFVRKSTGSILCVVAHSTSPAPAVFVEGFDGFEIRETLSREIDLDDPRR
jgi:hypothetical protein